MIEIYGNFWEEAPKYDALVCTINKSLKSNGELVMGAGIAKDFNDRFPGLAKSWGRATGFRGSSDYNAFFWYARHYGFDDQVLVGLPTKDDWRKPSRMDIIIPAIKSMLIWVNDEDVERDKILMTRPGCGLGGLKWEDVKKEIEQLLDNRFTVIHNEGKK